MKLCPSCGILGGMCVSFRLSRELRYLHVDQYVQDLWPSPAQVRLSCGKGSACGISSADANPGMSVKCDSSVGRRGRFVMRSARHIQTKNKHDKCEAVSEAAHRYLIKEPRRRT